MAPPLHRKQDKEVAHSPKALPPMQDHECCAPVPETWVAGLRRRTCDESFGLESQTGFQIWEARLCKILQVSLNINGTEHFL